MNFVAILLIHFNLFFSDNCHYVPFLLFSDVLEKALKEKNFDGLMINMFSMY